MKAILIVALLVIGACSVKAGEGPPAVFQPLELDFWCAHHFGWQCNNTMKYNQCAGNSQCIVYYGIAI